MKLSSLIAAAGLVIAGLGASTAANAQDYRGDRHDERRYDRDDRGRDHGDRYDYRHDNGRHRGQAYGHRRCRTEYRHHHRVTRCYR